MYLNFELQSYNFNISFSVADKYEILLPFDDYWNDVMKIPVCKFCSHELVPQWGSETKSRQMFHNSRHFQDVTFSQICSGNIASLGFYQLDADEILM